MRVEAEKLIAKLQEQVLKLIAKLQEQVLRDEATVARGGQSRAYEVRVAGACETARMVIRRLEETLEDHQ